MAPTTAPRPPLLPLLLACALTALRPCTAAQDPLTLGVTVTALSGSSSPVLTLTWGEGLPFTRAQVTWEKCSYADQVSCQELGRQTLADVRQTSFKVSEGVPFGSQCRVTLRGQDGCGHVTALTSYVTVPRPIDATNRAARGDPLYLVLGPVNQRNLTVSWGAPSGPTVLARSQAAYKVTWRRVDGQVGHPGHESGLVHSAHTVRGLTPATRYEVCVMEVLAATPSKACDTVHTREDAPGPPSPGEGSCRTEAHGTHWRCDVTWGPPATPNGKIIGYEVSWRDSEGYTLQEGRPPGALCSPHCQYWQVLTFRPHEGCVTALTAAGRSWEGCIRIHDTQSRLLAVFDRNLLMAVAITLLLYILGPRVMGALLRCCIRGLARQVGDGKDHAV